ncbi:serine hydrolase [Desulfopila inferna]|uniref:serine hydrolase n=1 Tax=Desulfopila inferna TaxID=468528 RepID=UPI0019628B97|nr:serine hydrolase [Desulfopila inferna]MBM9606497.1 serine hydrolase [Desulfopila inferna]
MIRILTILLFFVIVPCTVFAQNDQYDIAYIWDTSLENVIDYQRQLEKVLDPQEIDRLNIVRRDPGDYGLIYNLGGTALTSAQLMIQHSEALRQAGLSECSAMKNDGYYQLYNVSYGVGPNIEALKKVHEKISHYLGEEVEKNLFIVETGSENYALIYRRMGDRASTYAVAQKHRNLLKAQRISTAILPEFNNRVVFGTSPEGAATEPISTPVTEVVTVIPDASPALPKEEQPVITLTPDLVKRIVREAPSGNPQFEKHIEEFIGELRRKGELRSNERTSWMVYDLTKNEPLVNINSDQIFQAASMIKPFISLAFFHQVKEGGLVYGPKSRRNMEAMIQHSNNASTNWIMRMAGGPAHVEGLLRKHYGHIFKNTLIKEYIPAGGRTYKNSALPSDYVRFLLALWNDELPYSKEIRRLMSLPGRDRLYDGTPIPRGTKVYNKTGSTAYLCGDMGILVLHDKTGQPYPYVIVGIIEQNSRPKNYGHWMRTRGDVIRKVSTLVYEQIKDQYKL